MKKIWIIFIGIMFLGLVSGASYPSPFTTDNTATIIGNNNPTTEATSSISFISNLNTINFPIITQPKTDKKMFSEKEICKLMKGCWEEGCFPNGYRTGNKYCGLDKEFKIKYHSERIWFVNQSNSEEQCNNSFECKSNFCFKGECIDTIKTIDEEVVEISKSDLEELKNIIESAEKSMEEDYNKEVSKNFFSSLIDLFKKMFDW